MTDLALLNEMINPDATVPLEEHKSSKKKVTLKEKGNGGSYKMEILNVPDDAIVINIDDNFKNTDLFSSRSGEGDRADFIIVSERKGVVLFIEMKKGRPSKGKIIAQLKGGLCVFRYCQLLAEVFHNNDDFLGNGYRQCFVSLVKTKSNKGMTRIRQDTEDHNAPDKVRKFCFPSSIKFGKII